MRVGALLRAVVSVPARLCVLMIRLYQAAFSPLLPPMCRFHPSCSHYAVKAVQVHGVLWGGALAAWRIVRCNPFCKGGYDPVPPRKGQAGPGTAEETPED